MSYALKTLYPNKKVLDAAIQASASPFYAKVAKSTDFGGNNMVVPVFYADVGGRSHTFSEAQENKSDPLGKAFTVTRAKDYALASLDSEVILSSKGSEKAFVEALKRSMDSALNALGRSVGMQLFGDGTGSRGVVSSIASNVITLTRAGDATNFDVGQNIVVAASASGTPRGSGTGVAITAIDRDAGTLTIASTPASTAANDLIWIEGDYVSASDRLAMKGLGAWIPATAPTSGDSHFGVDRSADVGRLAGHRINASSYGTLKEALFAAAVKVAKHGGRPDTVFISHEGYESLLNDLGTKVQYSEFKCGEIAFEGAKVHGPAGTLEVIPDVNCRSDQAFVLQLGKYGPNTWELASLGQCPMILDLDGNKLLRESSSDSYEIRLAAFGNLVCRCPGWNAIVHTIS